MTVTVSGNNGYTPPSGSALDRNRGACAEFGALHNDTTSQLIMRNQTNGVTVPIYRTFATPTNISVSTSNNYWTHTYTGWYQLFIQFRQSSGGDIWNQFAVTKDGTSNAAGVSARMGSENAHTESVTLMYKVDSTSSNYRLQGWSLGDTYAGGAPSGNPYWYSGSTQTGWGGTYVGRCYNIIVIRVGDI